MSAFVELIKKIGIFMIAAQAVLHFAPGQKYEKYIKLIVGVMVLLQFLTPVYRMITKTTLEEGGISGMFFDMPTDTVPEEITDSTFVADTAINQLEEEIKFRLNQELSGENYSVAGVTVSMRTSETQTENWITPYEQYELERVRVVVRRTYLADMKNGGQDITGDGTDETKKTNKTEETDEIEDADEMQKISIDKIQIQKIDVTPEAAKQQVKTGTDIDTNIDVDTDTDTGASIDRRWEKEKELRQRFCSVLCLEEKQMEVSVYGAADEMDR